MCTALHRAPAALRSAWEAERSRLAAAEREAVRRMADQQRELRVREERLTQIRWVGGGEGLQLTQPVWCMTQRGQAAAAAGRRAQ